MKSNSKMLVRSNAEDTTQLLRLLAINGIKQYDYIPSAVRSKSEMLRLIRVNPSNNKYQDYFHFEDSNFINI